MVRTLRLMEEEPAMQQYKAQSEFWLGYFYKVGGRAPEAKHHLQRALWVLEIICGDHDEITIACKEDLEDLLQPATGRSGSALQECS